MKTLYIIGSLLVLASCHASSPTYVPKKIDFSHSTVKCTFQRGAIFNFKSKSMDSSSPRHLETEIFNCPPNDQGCYATFVDLGSENAKLVSAGGSSPIQVHKATGDLIVYEEGLAGTVNMYRIDVNTGLAIFTKNVDGLMGSDNYGAMYVGQCNQ